MKKSVIGPALRLTVVLTVLTGIIYPLLVTMLAQIMFPYQANGSLKTVNSTVVGSELISQAFTAPGYFHPRPSAAGNGYDAANSGGANLGPITDKMLHGVVDKANPKNNFDGIAQLADAVRKENNLPPDAVIPVDAVTRSASGLDPDISLAYAELQVPRVARQRGLREDQVRSIVGQATSGRQFGILGEPRVNVLLANMELDKAAPGRTGPLPSPSPSAAASPSPSPSAVTAP